MFYVKFFVKVKLLTEDHPFVEIHLITLVKELTKHAPEIITLLAKSFKDHFQVFI